MKFPHSYWLVVLLVAVVVLAGCSPQPAEPVVVTVINTVPVEVTRLVAVQQTVVVTQEVVITEVIEVQVPVTVTPGPTMEITATNEPSPVPMDAFGGLAPAAYATPTIDLAAHKEEKIQGFAPLKVTNETESTLVVDVAGVTYVSLTVGGHGSVIEIIPEGEYSYTVWEEGAVIYSGTIRLTNPDKHELVIYDNRVVYKVP
jgi:hypothetical protein